MFFVKRKQQSIENFAAVDVVVEAVAEAVIEAVVDVVNWASATESSASFRQTTLPLTSDRRRR